MTPSRRNDRYRLSWTFKRAELLEHSVGVRPGPLASTPLSLSSSHPPGKLAATDQHRCSIGLANLEETVAVTADDLDAALSSVVASLRPATDLDWFVRAGSLEWDCWHTAEHIGDCLMSFAGQLVARPEKRFVRFMATADKDASPEQVLEFAEAGGRILAATVRTSGPDVRAYHPTGQADPEGFAAMGCVETLLHGDDIAQGLGLAIDPPRDVCTRVLARLFPETAQELARVDPWAALRWSTGRIELPGRPQLKEWRWRGAPLGE